MIQKTAGYFLKRTTRVGLAFFCAVNFFNLTIGTLESSETVNILELDGGGSRTLLGLSFLKYLKQATNEDVPRRFKVAGGSSGGAIIGAGLTLPNDSSPSLPKYTADTLWDLFIQQRQNLFSSNTNAIPGITPLYSNTTLTAAATACYGEALFSSALVNTVTVSINTTNSAVTLFKSWDSPSDLKTTDAVLASVALPIFFAPQTISGSSDSFIDGSLVTNNSTLFLLEEAKKLYPQANFNILSLGPGKYQTSFLNQISAAAQDSKRIPYLAMENLLELQDRTIDNRIKKDPKVLNYWRINPDIDADHLAIDDVTDSTISYLEDVVSSYTTANQADLQNMITILKNS